jgi:1-acyl-sn-glycerol-3-phosphate acyltransferase
MQPTPGGRTAGRSYVLPPVELPIGTVAAVWLRKARAFDRAILIIGWTLVAMAIQALLLLLPGRGKVVFARFYWATFARLIGLRIRLVGTRVTQTHPGRPVVFVANHTSWLDIAVIGGRLETCFVSKDAVQDWPGINLVAKLGRTAYVTRQRATTGRESDVLRQRLDQGDNIVLFPEGTTDDGTRVLPFRSSFLSVAEGDDPPIVQPVSIVYDRLAGLPTGRVNRPLFAYYGEMNIGTHFWRLVQCHGFGATLLLHPPVDPRDYPNRKALSRDLERTISDGAAALRQNRPLPDAAGAGELAHPSRKENLT